VLPSFIEALACRESLDAALPAVRDHAASWKPGTALKHPGAPRTTLFRKYAVVYLAKDDTEGLVSQAGAQVRACVCVCCLFVRLYVCVIAMMTSRRYAPSTLRL
jgi:hypothetical protein